MKTIHKFPVFNFTTLQLPEDAEVLTVEYQNNEPFFWVLLDTNKPRITRNFEIVGTGNPLDDAKEYTYIGTLHDEPFVWHFFEVHIK